MSWLSQVYCRWPVACSLSATLQKELMEDNGPDLGGFGGWGLRSGPRSVWGDESGPDCITDATSSDTKNC